MDSEILETMLEDFKSELLNLLDGTNRYSEIRISYLQKAIKEIESELKKNKWNERIKMEAEQ
jgi:hypothetical protein